MLFKDKMSSGSIEYDTKTGKLLLKKELQKHGEKVGKSSEIQENDIGELSEERKQHLEKNYNKKIYEKILEYRDFCLVVHNTNFEILLGLLLFVAENNIAEKSELEFSSYVKTKINGFIELFDNNLKKGKTEFVRQLNLEKMTGMYYKLLFGDFKQAFYDIYNNHKNKSEKQKEFLQQLKNHADNEKETIFLQLPYFYKTIDEANSIDVKICIEVCQMFAVMCHGFFIDYIEDLLKND